ncbi:MAG TPA: hydroxymethylglutaryl-CoA lyase [Solirubrobacteraceae bacterium]|nr:hydroxymethylglutaryl-CoA lyase [Solirubrobacteraceae bacterium]
MARSLSVPSLPAAVSVREVGPRDGLQNEPEVIATVEKVALIEALAATGVARIEVSSFVSPRRIPQLADAEEVLSAAAIPVGVLVSVLVPNRRGLERALALRERGEGRIDQVTVFLSASETHNRKNVNAPVAASLAAVSSVIEASRSEGLRCEGVISTAFGCPYEGHVDPRSVLAIARHLVDAGAQEVALADTTGMANPRQVQSLFVAAREALGGEVELTAHFHNTRGAGLANVLGALQVGIDSFESSVGELGGCPVPPGATGNIASEDLVSMLSELDIRTGVDLDALIACAARAQELLGRPLGSHLLRAGPVRWVPEEL